MTSQLTEDSRRNACAWRRSAPERIVEFCGSTLPLGLNWLRKQNASTKQIEASEAPIRSRGMERLARECQNAVPDQEPFFGPPALKLASQKRTNRYGRCPGAPPTERVRRALSPQGQTEGNPGGRRTDACAVCGPQTPVMESGVVVIGWRGYKKRARH